MKRVVVVSFLLLGSWNAFSASQKLAPNSPIGYLNPDKRFNEITWLMTHNSTATTVSEGAKTYWADSNRVVSDQMYGLTRQLKDGVRAFKLPVHMAVPFTKENFVKSFAPVLAAQKAVDHAHALLEKVQGAERSARSKRNELKRKFDKKQDVLNRMPKYLRKPLEKAVHDAQRLFNKANSAVDRAQRSVGSAEGVLSKAQESLKAAMQEFKKGTAGTRSKGVPYVFHGLNLGDARRALRSNVVKKLVAKDPKAYQLKEDDIVDWLFNSGMTAAVDLTSKSLEDVLTEMKEFLKKYPYELLTVYVQTENIKGEPIAEVVEKVFPASMLYVHTVDTPWPAIKDIQGKLILFADAPIESDRAEFLKKYPWYMPHSSYGFFSKYNFEAPGISQKAVKKALKDLMNLDKSTRLDSGSSDQNKVSFLFHFITGVAKTPLIASGFPLAAQASNTPENIKKRWTFFKDRWSIDAYTIVPTFVVVDFYSIGNVANTIYELNKKFGNVIEK